MASMLSMLSLIGLFFSTLSWSSILLPCLTTATILSRNSTGPSGKIKIKSLCRLSCYAMIAISVGHLNVFFKCLFFIGTSVD